MEWLTLLGPTWLYQLWNERILEEVGAFAQGKTNNKIEQYTVLYTQHFLYYVCKTVGIAKANSVGSGTGALNSDLTVNYKGTVQVRE
jgi:hypothetical protein